MNSPRTATDPPAPAERDTGVSSRRRRLRGRGDLTAAYVPARTEVATLAVVVAVSAAQRRLRGQRDLGATCVPARTEVTALAVVVAVSAVPTALPLPIRWS
ncbi:hypothetical protein EOT10_23800 [Streptomyces antnestii]|uniref:Uncharacterized protein n=1 Tax=Streptomyces antnestii TaxID=2494256 RepID=A0A437PIW8_9ACTN|nr:hypothetical protein [Streptomyces sp. San01]RVU21994.1 hypothetical protein EOT10_23800 [Streptomyces sp. San01]